MALLTDKVVLVSGGTQGVGAGVARAAAREGAAVAVTGRRREPGQALAAELQAAGATARFVRADVADVAQAQGSVARVVAELGRVDCLVNAAGLTARGTLLDTTPELFDAHIAVNLRAPFFLMQAAVRDMLARKAPGTIVNIISSSELGGQPYLAPYVAAKAGQAGLTRNAAHAHRPQGPSPWASSARSTRSPTSWCSCCRTAAASSPGRSSTGTRTSSAAWTERRLLPCVLA